MSKTPSFSERCRLCLEPLASGCFNGRGHVLTNLMDLPSGDPTKQGQCCDWCNAHTVMPLRLKGVHV
jgi:hypothetical protein